MLSILLDTHDVICFNKERKVVSSILLISVYFFQDQQGTIEIILNKCDETFRKTKNYKLHNS